MNALIYTSKAVDSFDSPEIYDMLTDARIFNKEHRITGCLLYHQKQFIQLLEGEAKEVHKLYDKIAQDPRHESLSLLMEERMTSRIFYDWNMAFYEFGDPEEDVIFKKHQLNTFFDNSKLFTQSSKTGLIFFKSVRDLLSKN